MDSVQTLAGTTIAISAGLPATIDEPGYVALTFTAIGEVITVGEFGRTYQEVTHLPIATRAVQKFKGSFDEGSASFSIARDDDDAGQVLVATALASDADYSFEVTYQDGGKDYFKGKIMSFPSVGGGSDDLGKRNMNIGITSGSLVES